MITNNYYIKASLLHYFRFLKGMDYAATECAFHSFNIADVVASDGKKLVEVEIKLSKYDLKSDKVNKATKHKFAESDKRMTMGGEELPSQAMETGRPSHFYFCVSKELAEDAIKEANSINTKYGVLVCYDKLETHGCRIGKYGSGILGYNIKVVKKAYQLHNLPIEKRALYLIAARTSSELTNFYKDAYIDKANS